MGHPGMLINIKNKKLEEVLSIKQAKMQEIRHKSSQEKASENLYIYACCFKGLNEPGEVAYMHIQEGEDDPL